MKKLLVLVALTTALFAASAQSASAYIILYGTNASEHMGPVYDAATYYGLGGNDQIYGWYYGDLIYGGHDGDGLNGNQADDRIYAGCESGCSQAGELPDTLRGGDGWDTLAAQNGKYDVLHGGNGWDTCWVDYWLDSWDGCEDLRLA